MTVDVQNDLTGKIAGEISIAEEHFSPSDQKRYRLPLLLSITRRVAFFSPDCEVCQGLQGQIVSLGEDLTSQPLMNRQHFKGYLSVIKGITGHLKRSHGLAEERQYIKRYVLMGLAFGLSIIVLGLILLSFGITLLTLHVTIPALIIRLIFGYTIGCFLDRRARKRDRVL